MTARLKRTLNLPQLVFYGISSMVGAGIYSVIGAAAGEAGPHLWISFLLAALAAFISVLSYAEISTLFPAAGAEYQYLSKAFPRQKLLAFLGGYLVVLNACTTAATVSLAFGGYLNVFLDWPVMATALVLLMLCTLVNIAGIRESVLLTIVMALVEVGGLLLMIGLAFASGNMDKAVQTMPALPDMTGIFSATALIFFVYIGFEDIADLSEETIKPKQTVPKALLISLAATSVVYILIAFAVTALATPDQLGQSASPLSAAVAGTAPWASSPLAIAALFATASTALISLVSMSRVLFGMARDGEMPHFLGKTLPERKTPWTAALALFITACLFLPLGEVKILASVSSLGVLLVFIGVQAAVIRLRYTRPEAHRPFKVPLSIGRLPLIPVVGILLCLAMTLLYEPIVYGVTLAAMVFGALLYVLHKKTRT
jgi:APA family basic amino acid/polyamine antiporter